MLSSIAIYSQPKLYYSDNDFSTPQDLLRSYNIETGSIDTLIESIGSPHEIEVDYINKKIYWVNHYGNLSSTYIKKTNRILRCNFDGTGVETIIEYPTYKITDIELDLKSGKIYWAEYKDDYIKRANLDGSNEEFFLKDLNSVISLDIDTLNNKMYWIEYSDGNFKRSGLDGSNIESIFSFGWGRNPNSINVDPENQKIYWLKTSSGQIYRCDYDGTNQEVFYTDNGVNDIFLDSHMGYVVYTRSRNSLSQIISINLATKSKTILYNDNNSGIFGITYDHIDENYYWTNSNDNKIRSFNSSSTESVEILLTNIYNEAWGLTINNRTDKIIWGGQGGQFGKCNIDGSEPEEIINGKYYAQGDIVVDCRENTIYWNDPQLKNIQTANTDGTEIKIIIDSTASGIDLDLSFNKIYWTTNSNSIGKIIRANYDGSEPEILVTGIDTPDAIKLDLKNRKMYWTGGSSLIQRANMDGTNVETLIESGLENPEALALDIVEGKMYWSETGTYSNPAGRIRRADFDGSQIEDIIDSDIIRCKGIALQNLPPNPDLLSPQNNDSIGTSNEFLKWHACNNAGYYNLQISEKNDFSDLTLEVKNLYSNSYKINNINTGKYYWRVSAENTIGESDWSPVFTINVKNTPVPVANFISDVSEGTQPLTVQFSDLSQNHVSTWNWDFGDGNTSDEQNPIHVYSNTGTYSVTLAVSGNGGNDIVTKTDYITVTDAGPIADFSGDITNGEQPLTVRFTDLSQNHVSSWEWNFGDGNSSSEQNPVHTFVDAGKYTISLTVAGNGGSNSISKSDYINVSHAAPVADFTSNITEGESPLQINFIDLSQNHVSSWAWDFGDGSTSSEQFPTHFYTEAGSYTVKLYVSGNGGTDTKIINNFITVYDATPVADFTSDVTIGKKPLTVQFTDQSYNHISGWEWNFGDGNTRNEQNPVHIYTMTGTFSVTLTVTGNGGIGSLTKNDYITVTEAAPIAEFIADIVEGENPLTVNFTDLSENHISSWTWNFGDGNSSSEQNPAHTYEESGTFTVGLFISGDGGTDTELKTDYINVLEPTNISLVNSNNLLKIYPNPAKSFTVIKFQALKKQNTFIQLINSNGEVLKEYHVDNKVFENQEYLINTSAFSNGIYYIVLNRDNTKSIKELIIAK